MQSAAEAKARLRAQMRQAELQIQALNQLSDKIREVVADVDLTIGGTLTGKDRDALQQLHANLEALDRLVGSLGAAVKKGEEAADDIR